MLKVFSSEIPNFKDDLQEIYKAFSTQGFLATPLPIPRVGEYKVFRPQTFFDWQTSILTRNIGKQFQTVQIETFIIVLHYCLNGGYINKEIDDKDCVELVAELKSTYDYFSNFTKDTKYIHSIE